MKVGEAVGYGILIFIGLGALKLFGGLKGLTDLFGGLFGAPETALSQGKTPQQIITETQQLEEQFATLTPAGQKLATEKVSIGMVEEQLQKAPEFVALETIVSGFDIPFLGIKNIPIIGGLAEATVKAIETIPSRIEAASEYEYMKSVSTKNLEVPAYPERQLVTPELTMPTSFQELSALAEPEESLHGQAYVQNGFIMRVRGR